jgi:hypothetical protein
MEYSVLSSFTDLEDKTAKNGENVYWAGKSTYPRSGYTPTQERLNYLQSDKNPRKKPVISGGSKKAVITSKPEK